MSFRFIEISISVIIYNVYCDYDLFLWPSTHDANPLAKVNFIARLLIYVT